MIFHEDILIVDYAKDKNTLRSHYVWRHHLQSFSFDGKNIHVFDKKSKKATIQMLKNTAVNRRLYSLKGSFSTEDIDNFKKLLHPKKDEEFIINEMIAYLNNDPIFLEEFPINNMDEFKKQCEEHIGRNALERNQEDLFCFYEDNFKHLYHALIDGNCSFYNSHVNDSDVLNGFWAGYWRKLPRFLRAKRYDLRFELLRRLGTPKEKLHKIRKKIKNQLNDIEKRLTEDQCIVKNDTYLPVYYFLTFLVTQYFRTPMIEKAHTRLQEFQAEKYPESESDPKKFIALFTHLNLYHLSATLIQDKYKIVFLETNCSKFITSDQPIINTFGGKSDGPAYDELEFYFPLTPRLAILFTSDGEFRGKERIEVSPQTVKKYNALMWKLSHERLFSSCKIQSDNEI